MLRVLVRDAEGAGDLLATASVVMPSELDADQRAAMQAFAATTPSPRRHLVR